MPCMRLKQSGGGAPPVVGSQDQQDPAASARQQPAVLRLRPGLGELRQDLPHQHLPLRRCRAIRNQISCVETRTGNNQSIHFYTGLDGLSALLSAMAARLFWERTIFFAQYNCRSLTCRSDGLRFGPSFRSSTGCGLLRSGRTGLLFRSIRD